MQKLKFSEKLGFGLGVLPGAANSLLAAFLTLFYTDSLGMAAGAVGTMFLISKVFDGITDLIVGNLIDKTKTRWGKARPWLLWGAVPTGLALILIFMIPVNASETGKLIYAFLTYNFFTSIMYTIVGVAGNSLMPLMTQDSKNRGILATISMLFGLGGTMLAMAVTFPFVTAMGGDIRAWRIVFSIYGVICTVGILCSFFFTREHVQAVEDTVNTEGRVSLTFAESIKNFVHNKYFLFSLFAGIMMSMALNLNSGSQTYFYKYNMNDELLTTKLNLVSLIPTLISIVFLATPCLHFLGKKKSVYLGAGGQIVAFIIRGVAAITGSYLLLVIGTIIGGLATGPLSIPIGLLTADAVDYGEYLTNKRIEGTGSAISSFVGKITSGLSSALVGWILQWTGYVANGVQNASSLAGISALYAWIPMILLIVLIIAYAVIYHYDEEEPKVLAELERRKNTL